jgi:hypothetical protein
MNVKHKLEAMERGAILILVVQLKIWIFIAKARLLVWDIRSGVLP